MGPVGVVARSAGATLTDRSCRESPAGTRPAAGLHPSGGPSPSCLADLDPAPRGGTSRERNGGAQGGGGSRRVPPIYPLVLLERLPRTSQHPLQVQTADARVWPAGRGGRRSRRGGGGPGPRKPRDGSLSSPAHQLSETGGGGEGTATQDGKGRGPPVAAWEDALRTRPALFPKRETSRGKPPFTSVKLAWPSPAPHPLGILGGSAGSPSYSPSRPTREMPLP